MALRASVGTGTGGNGSDVDSGFIDILVFAAIAGFVFFRLFSVLGRRTGNERPPTPLGAPSSQADPKSDKVVELPRRNNAQAPVEPGFADGPLAAGLTQVRLADPDFDLDSFMAGARAAFEMIIEAFHKGELEKVKAYIADDVYKSFAAAIAEQRNASQVRVMELVSVGACEAIEAEVRDRSKARITVRFTSEQTDVVKDSEGRIVAGDPTQTEQIVDIWTFARDTRSRDPNWQLAATRSPD